MEGWSVMDDPFYEGKQILFKDYSGQLDDEVFSSSAIHKIIILIINKAVMIKVLLPVVWDTIMKMV